MRRILLAGLFAPLVACTTYVRLDYTPSPAEVLVTAGDDNEPAARVLVSVLAAERPDRDSEQPFELHLRLRIENLGSDQVVFDATDLLLVGSDLAPYAAPRLTGPVGAPPGAPVGGPFDVPADAATTVDAYFPLPDGPYDVEGLNLRFSLRLAGRAVLLGASFEPQQYVYPYPYRAYDPFYGYPYGYIGYRQYHCY